MASRERTGIYVGSPPPPRRRDHNDPTAATSLFSVLSFSRGRKKSIETTKIDFRQALGRYRSIIFTWLKYEQYKRRNRPADRRTADRRLLGRGNVATVHSSTYRRLAFAFFEISPCSSDHRRRFASAGDISTMSPLVTRSRHACSTHNEMVLIYIIEAPERATKITQTR